MKTAFTFLLCLLATLYTFGQNKRQSRALLLQQQQVQLRQQISHLPAQIQQQVLRQASTVSRPGTEERYTWSGNSWLYLGTLGYTYDAAGNTTSTTITTAGNNQPELRILDTYNSANQKILTLEQDWIGNHWTDAYRITRSYDAHGNLVLKEEQYLGSSGWETDAAERYTYTYNTSGHMTSMVEEGYYNGSWQNQRKMELVQGPGGAYTQATHLLWDSIAWMPMQHHRNIVWHDLSTDRRASYTVQFQQNGNWQDAERYTLTYGQNESVLQSLELADGQGNWLEVSRLHMYFDAHHNYTGYYYEITGLTNWQLMAEEKHLLTYDAQGNLTESIVQFRDQNTPVLMNLERSVFSEFYLIAAAPEAAAAVVVQVWPNPAAGRMQVSAEAAAIEWVQLVDATGRQVYAQAVKNPAPAAAVAVDLQQLPTGLYLLRAHTSSGVVEQRVVKH